MVSCRGKQIAPSSRDGTMRTPGQHAFESAIGGTISPSETTALGRSASSKPRHATTTRRPKRRCSTWRRARGETTVNVTWRVTRGEYAFLRCTFRGIAMVSCRGKVIAPSSRDGTMRAPGQHVFKSAIGGTISPPKTTALGRSASSRPRHATTTRRRPKRRCSTWRRARSETKRKGGHRNDPDERRNTYDEL